MITAITVLLASAIGTTALPLAKSGAVSPTKFTVDAIPNPNYIRNGPAALRKVLNKYSLPMPPGLAKRQDGTATATPSGEDIEYIVPVTIGGQMLHLDFDTGSSDLWTFGNALNSSLLGNHTGFIPSSSFQPLSGYTWSISYGDGSFASGTVGTDTVSVGGTAVELQAIELATEIAGSFISDSSSDGLLGLAFSTLNTVTPKSQKTFFENAISSLDCPLFTANLKHNAVGSYDFGYIDSTKYTGTLNFVDIETSSGFWEFQQPEYKVGNGNFLSSGSGATAIADTGTTLMLVSDEMAKNYYDKVVGATFDSNQNAYVFPCSATLPSFSVKIGSNYATVAGQLINYASLGDGTHRCYGGIQGYDGSQFIFGDIFLKNFLVVFDDNNGKPKLGYAPAAH